MSRGQIRAEHENAFRSYESGVIASIIQLPAWITHLGYDPLVGIPE